MSDSIYVAVGDRHFRTKSIDRVARRLHGPNGRVVVQATRNGRIQGFFVVPEKGNPNVFIVKERFREEDPEVARILRAEARATEKGEPSGPYR